MKQVNINSIESILDFCLDGVDDFSSITKGDIDIFLHAVREVFQDLNKFDFKKHKCSLSVVVLVVISTTVPRFYKII